MLKTVSSITNAIGALNYKGAWNASINSPALSSGVGIKGDYYVVSVAGTTSIDGISNWGVGDWVAFNGSVWQRLEGGADLNGSTLNVTGAATVGGNFLGAKAALGTTDTTYQLAVNNNGNLIASFYSYTTPEVWIINANGSAGSPSAQAAKLYVKRDSSTSRSINAAGTINASGADYSEYMRKESLDVIFNKGDIVGINKDGRLTNVFADAIAFGVKSTEPGYVGGDSWGRDDVIGKQPMPAPQSENETAEQYQQRCSEFDTNDKNKLAWKARFEAERQWVDRIAFAGQVPVNVRGANPGQYIVPTDDNGAIKGTAMSERDMQLGDYMIAVGRVIAVDENGRAKIIVKIS